MRKAILFLIIWGLGVNSVYAYSGGSGEPNAPYQIANVADLLTLANDTNNYNKCFVLTADIDLDPNLPGGQVFTTAIIARDTDNSDYDFEGNSFTGAFDGAGHKISKLTIDTGGVGNNYLGLFGYVAGGEIKNLGIENISITGGYRSYYLGGFVGYNGGTISNCYSTGTVTSWPSFYLGGLVGWNDGTISNCYSAGNVNGEVGSECLGGLVGWNDGTISNCYSTGTVTGGYESRYVGGLVGENGGSISNCYSTGVVTEGYYLGGLVGWNEYGTISNCYSMGSVSGDEDIGGLAGGNSGTISNCYSTGIVTGGRYLGGLVGYSYSGTIGNCYSTGDVTGGYDSYYLGELVGEADSGDISGCYFLINRGYNNGYGTPLPDAQMRQQSSFVDWDFIGETTNGMENIWRMCVDTVNYPLLWWQFDIADFNCPDGVDFTDFATLANAWLSDHEQTNWNPRCDIAEPPDNIINILDLAVFCDNWLKSDCINCQSTCNYDGYCGPGEANWCPDCGGPICGNGVCEPGEEGWCYDCQWCGNGICELGEEGWCSDCQCNNNGNCDWWEGSDCSDCQGCNYNGYCDWWEGPDCPDCWWCGDGICQPGEEEWCPEDCPM